MPRKRRLNETTDTGTTTATMPPPPEGATERVEADSDENRILDEETTRYTTGDAPASEVDDPEAAEVFDREMDRLEAEAGSAPTPEHTYTVAEDGTVSNVQAAPAKPATNGSARHITFELRHGPSFVPERCKFCGGKCPPHPAKLVIGRVLGKTEILICAKCDEVFTEFQALLGQGEISLEIVAPGGVRQADMLDELEAAVPGDEDDVDGPPAEDVARRIREIAAKLPEKFYDQGAAAFCEGIAIEDNPYAGEPGPLNADRAKLWNAGWLEAKVDALRAAGEGETADALLSEAAKTDPQTAVQALADELGAKVTVRGLDLEGNELGRVEASPSEPEPAPESA